MSKIKKMPLSADIGTTQPEDVVEFPSMLKAWADEAAALEADLDRTTEEAGAHALYIKELRAENTTLEARLEAYECLQKSSQAALDAAHAQIARLQKGEAIESDYLTKADDTLIEELAEKIDSMKTTKEDK